MAYINLPAARAPANAMLNFAPLERAITGIRNRNRQAEIDEQNAMARQQASRRADASLGLQKDRLGMQKTEFAQSQRDRTIKKIAGVVQLVEGPEQWSRLMQSRPEIANSLTENGIDPSDWQMGRNAILAEAQGYQDPLDRRLKLAQVEKAERGADSKLEFKTVDKRGFAFDPETGSAKEIYTPKEGGGGDVPPAVKAIIEKADIAYTNLVPALDDYAATIKKTGVNILPGADKDAVLRKRRNIQLQMKELFNLGVLNGPDLELMDNLLFNPNVDSYADITNIYDASNRAQQSVNDIKEQLRNMRNTYTNRIGRAPIGPSGDVPQTETVQANSVPQAPAAQDYPVLSPEQAMQQPPGTLFRTQDGRLKRVPGGQSQVPQVPQGR